MSEANDQITQLEDEVRKLNVKLKETHEKQSSSEELTAVIEELSATNEELSATTDELHKTNAELEKYRTQLELMVESKTKELTINQENLLLLSQRQALFIKVLQILQLEDDLPKAMNMALAEIGQYTGVSRMQIWENNSDGLTYGVSYEWCNEGVEPSMHYLKTVPLDFGKPWFDMLLSERMICTWDIQTLHPAMIEILKPQGVQSIVVLPLAEYGVFFGYISFTVTERRVWEDDEIELLKNIAQIVSTASKRYQAETIIKQSQQVMRTVLDNINANIFVTDFETMEVRFANASFIKEVGRDMQGEICWQALQAGLDCPCIHCPKAILVNEQRRPIGVRYWEDYNPLTKCWYTIVSTALEWVDGRLAILELATDITDRKHAEIELVHAREKAEESDILKSAFLANMSHEIRTPINGIAGFVQLLNDDSLSAKRRQEYISIINNSSAQLVKLIDDIVDVAKIEAKQMNINPVTLNVNSLMSELLLFFEIFIQNTDKQHVSLVLDDSNFIDNCVIFVDSTRLRQVISNLITNAIKYTDKGYIRFSYRQSSPDKLEFAVEDSGIGIKPEHKDIIFERFRQVELTNSRKYGGTGLGLNISRSLVDMMGGEMWVESVEGEGSSFFFTISYLPITPENENFFKPQSVIKSSEELLNKRVLLVVEPEIMKFKYIEKLLNASGFAAKHIIDISHVVEFISTTTCSEALIMNKSALTQASDEQINKIKAICAGMSIILIGDKQNNPFENAVELEEPINHEEFVNILKGLKGTVCTK